MKRILLLLSICLLMGMQVMGQAKKPKLMVVPSDAWCIAKGYVQEIDNQGIKEDVPDYKKAVQNDRDLNNVMAKIGILMVDKGFPLQSLSQTLKSVQTMDARRSVTLSKDGSGVSVKPLDELNRVAKADIILELDWTVNTNGPKHSITYNLVALDAYTNVLVAGAEGVGAPSLAAELPVLLEEAVQNNMDNFVEQLQGHFDDLLTNGREVVVDVMVFDDDANVDLETEYNGVELTEILDDWMANNTVNHRFSKSEATETYILFDQVRIPLYKANGMPMDTESFVREMMKFLRQPPYNLVCKVAPVGLGRCQLIIGKK